MRKLRVPLIVLALLVVAHVATTWVLANSYEAELDRIRASGDPVLPTDLATEPVPDADNVAVGLREASEWLARHHEATPEPDALEYAEMELDLEADDWAEIDRYFASLEPYLDLVEASLERPRYHLDVEWDAGPEMVVELIPRFQEIVTAFEQWALYRQDAATLNDRIVRTARVCRRLADRCPLPFVIGHLVGDVSRATVVRLVFNRRDEPGFDAARLQRELDPFLHEAERGPPALPLVEERAGGLWMFELWRSGRRTGLEELSVADGWYTSRTARPLVYLDGLRFLEMMRDAIDGCDVSPRDALRRPRHAEQQWPHNVAALYVGLPQKLYQEYGADAARYRLCRIALALMARAEWPATLEELGDLPVDPFSGEPFLYERTDTRVRLWCARGGEDSWENNADDNLAWEWKR